MSEFDWFATKICSFLLTYLLHSTVIAGTILLFERLSKLLTEPVLLVIAWKLAILLPILTTCAVALFPTANQGFQFSLSNDEDAFEIPAVSQIADWNQSSVRPESSLSSMVILDKFPKKSSSTEKSNVKTSTRAPFMTTAFSLFSSNNILLLVSGLWASLACLGIGHILLQLVCLRRLRKDASICSNKLGHIVNHELLQKMKILRKVELLESPRVCDAFTAGIRNPFIVVPANDPEGVNVANTRSEWEALLSHELAHIAHRDPVWNLLVQVLKHIFFFQPLNHTLCRKLRISMEFAADESAVATLGQGVGLAKCLVRWGDRFPGRQAPRFARWGIVVGMVAFRSPLGQRIERLLDNSKHAHVISLWAKLNLLILLVFVTASTAIWVPKAVAQDEFSTSKHTFISEKAGTMKSKLSTLAILIGLTSPVSAEETRSTKPAQEEQLKSTSDELPAGIRRFNGMLVGRLAAKDVEKGSFVVVVDAVPRVWRNSRAENPKSIVGKSVEVQGVFGKFLDVLVTTRIGETIEFECKHGEDELVFPGELLRKVAPYSAEDYPVLPEEFRGFRGSLVADIEKKDPETFELIIEVKKIREVWKDNAAKRPESIVGKKMMLAGFWNRKEAYHKLKVGSRIEVGMQHIGRQSDHLTVAEFVRSGDDVSLNRMRLDDRSGKEMKEQGSVQGFRGMLVGRLVKKDVERGTFTVTVDAVPRVWKNNTSKAPKSLIGRDVDLAGVPTQLLDALVVTRIGETLQFGALDDGEGHIRVGEVLRKVAPVEKGDYPVLPDAFRGFRGILKGQVVKKDEHLWDLTIQVSHVGKSFENDQSQNASSIIDKQVMLSGFWNKRDAYHSISVGDKIQVGVEHPQKLGDQLSVIEGVRKLEE